MIAGVLLAAGASTRMGGLKALARTGGESFTLRGIRNLWSACDRVVVVLGSGAPRIRRGTEGELGRLVGATGSRRGPGAGGAGHLEARFLVHPGWADGMLSSARVGLRAALRARPEAALVLPGHPPPVRPAPVQDPAPPRRQPRAA